MTTFRAWLKQYDGQWEKQSYIEDKWICDLASDVFNDYELCSPGHRGCFAQNDYHAWEEHIRSHGTICDGVIRTLQIAWMKYKRETIPDWRVRVLAAKGLIRRNIGKDGYHELIERDDDFRMAWSEITEGYERSVIFDTPNTDNNLPIANSDKYLYFIQCGQFVKIGQAKDVNARIKALATGAPEALKLIASFPNMGNHEKHLHKKFKHLHSNGEWFQHTDEIDNFINELMQS